MFFFTCTLPNKHHKWAVVVCSCPPININIQTCVLLFMWGFSSCVSKQMLLEMPDGVNSLFHVVMSNYHAKAMIHSTRPSHRRGRPTAKNLHDQGRHVLADSHVFLEAVTGECLPFQPLAACHTGFFLDWAGNNSSSQWYGDIAWCLWTANCSVPQIWNRGDMYCGKL